MPTVDDDLNISRGLLGLAEDPPGSNHNFITDWYADRIGDNGFRRAPWCAMSRSYTFDQAGGDLTYAYCPFIERDAKAGVNGLVWLGMTAEVGAWVLFDFVGRGYATHIGHVEAVNGDGTIITLEGNIGDAYRREHRDMQYVRGFARPPFTETPAATPDDPQAGHIQWTPTPPIIPGAFPASPAASSVPPWPGRVLKVTRPLMSGHDVELWQAQMAARGWPIDVDGVYGPASAQVATAFQTEKGLEVDGMVGPETWAAAWTEPVT